MKRNPSENNPVGVSLLHSLGRVFPRGFASCEWRYLTFLNYAVDPAVLLPRVPRDTELDLFDGKAWLSLVGLVFRNTRVLGVKIPFQQNYQQVNLQFCVRRKIRDRWRRGVVFVREIVPHAGLALAARLIYNESYSALPVRRKLTSWDLGMKVEYSWNVGPLRERILAKTIDRNPQIISPGSLPEFLTYRLWGYTPQRNGTTAELRLRHPRWRIFPAIEARAELRTDRLFGRELSKIVSGVPDSAFIAEGSAVQILEVDRISN